MRTCSPNSGRLGLRTGGRSPSVLVADPTPFLAKTGRRLLHTSYPRPPRAVVLGCTAGDIPCGSGQRCRPNRGVEILGQVTFDGQMTARQM
jgi:hypothetical protein